jgi:hypothetical protein
MQRLWMTSLAMVAAGAGCFFSGDNAPEPVGGALSVGGTLVDFVTGAPLEAEATVSTSGLEVAPTIKVTGATVAVINVPENSAFQLLATAPPLYRATFGPAVTVGTEDVADLKVPVVSEAFITAVATAFAATPTAARGILLARLVGADGNPKAGVAASNLLLSGGTAVSPPKFLDATLKASPTATVSSTSGWVVFFEVAPGVVSLSQAATANVTLDMAVSPVNPASVTIAEIKVTDGPPPKISNVSFATQVLPIFAARGCVACHSGNGPGKDLGGLTLNAGATKVYKELVVENPARVRPGMPETSLLLTMPSRESPPDRHPNVTFASATDPDFQKIYVWIKEGAKEN